MGYCISQIDAKFTIPRKHHVKALSAVKKLFATRFKRSYVTRDDADEWETLADAIESFGYTPELDSDYNIVGIEHHQEKMSDEESMFKAIAPYVDSGSYIEMYGDGGERWRWVFDDGKLEEINAILPWEDEE